MTADSDYLSRTRLADHHHLPISELAEWETADLDNALGLRRYDAESCGRCHVHPSVWKKELGGHHNALVAKWVYCRVCELIDLANDAGPPSEDKGWHLDLVPTGRHPSRHKT